MIRELRRRLGLTQRQLAEALNVDQGTVSRWERGTETPRPARRAEIEALLLRDESRRAMLRSLAVVRQDYLPSTLLDNRLRLMELSASGRRFFQERGVNPDALVGKDLKRYTTRHGIPDVETILRRSGLLSGDALLFRFVTNARGRAHVTVYEPIFESGTLVGVLNFVTDRFQMPDTADISIALAEAVRIDDPSVAEVLHRGQHAEEALRHLRAP